MDNLTGCATPCCRYNDHVSLLKYTKSSCGVDFLLNTATSREKRPWFDIDTHYRTDFFEFYFFNKASGFMLLNGERIVLLELGIGSRNRLIKLPMMQLAAREPNATYITLNLPQKIYVPDDITAKSIALPGDLAESLKLLRQ